MQLKLLQNEKFKKQQKYGDLIGNKTADKFTKVSRTLTQNTSETVKSESKNKAFDRDISKER